MQRWNSEFERREAMRMAKRLPCAVWVGSDRYEGVLEQVSARAVLVRTEADVPAAQEAKLTFSTPDGATVVLRTQPAPRRVVAHTLRGLLPRRVVMHVLEPTDAYLRWVHAPAVPAS
jgi:hypothetical protein